MFKKLRELFGEWDSSKRTGARIWGNGEEIVIVLEKNYHNDTIYKRLYPKVSFNGLTKFHPSVRYGGDLGWEFTTLEEVEALQSLTGLEITGAVFSHPDRCGP